jgi:hypothetical protein
VDGTSPPVRVKTLAVYWLDEARSLWHRMPGSTVDTGAKTVSAATGHFSVFAVMGQADTDLSRAHAHPVPYRGAGPITFNGLAQSARIKIFDMGGNRVADLEDSDGDGTLDWDVRDERGQAAPSGVYQYLIESGSQKKKGKLVIVR